MPEWKFREMQKSEVAIDPVQTQFFTTNIVGGLSSALVRESLQNSIDARLKRDETARTVFVEYRILEIDFNDFKIQLFNGLTEHLKAKKSGISPENIPDFNSSMKVLVIEDYNTIGLPGSIHENRDPDDNDPNPHNFYWFWRRVGKSGKRGDEIGRWGLGKTVFPAASKINSFFGLTVRDDDGKKYLMGTSTLKTHHLDGAETRIYPYGFLGIYFDEEDEYFVSPVSEEEDDEYILTFEKEFGIQRKSQDNKNLVGFSVIIPFIWEEININDLTRSVIEQFYYPILTGNLIIKIEDRTTNRAIDINEDNLEQITQHISFDENEGMSADEVDKLFKLSKWAIDLKEEDVIVLNLPNINSDPIWRMDWYLDEALRNSIKQKTSNFFTGERIAFKVPVKVHKRGEDPEFSYFKVFFEYDRGSSHGENYFIRDGITISSVRPLLKKGLRILTIIEKNKLAALLGDSENPAHTEWQRDVKSLKEKYIFPEKTISFVINSLSNLYSLIIQPKAGLDYDALQDIFYLDNEEDENELRPQAEGGDRENTPRPEINIEERSPQRYFLSKINGGFKVTGNERIVTLGLRLRIQVAYMIGKGNPLKKYNPFDFDLSSDQFHFESEGIIIEQRSNNIIEFVTEVPYNFSLKVTGFDEDRDIYIKIS